MMTSLGARLTETMEREVAKPMAHIESINTSLNRLDHMLSEREHKRGRLWYWLFGTRDWIAASWPSQAHRSTDDWKALRALWKR
jgi:hypothetical protein